MQNQEKQQGTHKSGSKLFKLLKIIVGLIIAYYVIKWGWGIANGLLDAAAAMISSFFGWLWGIISMVFIIAVIVIYLLISYLVKRDRINRRRYREEFYDDFYREYHNNKHRW